MDHVIVSEIKNLILFLASIVEKEKIENVNFEDN